jgi:hypothetical protein
VTSTVSVTSVQRPTQPHRTFAGTHPVTNAAGACIQNPHVLPHQRSPCMSECAALLCRTKQSAPAGSAPWSSPPVNAETTRRCSSWKKLVVTCCTAMQRVSHAARSRACEPDPCAPTPARSRYCARHHFSWCHASQPTRGCARILSSSVRAKAATPILVVRWVHTSDPSI